VKQWLIPVGFSYMPGKREGQNFFNSLKDMGYFVTGVNIAYKHI
jgi:hypothetical protein